MAKKTKKSTSARGNVKDLTSKFKKTQSDLEEQVTELSALAASLKLQIDGLKKELDAKDSQICHLEGIMAKSVPLIGHNPLTQVMDEVTIARIQLNKLGKLALERDLTMEETKRFDIFAKVVQQDERLDQVRDKPVKSRLKDVPKSELNVIAAQTPKLVTGSDE